MSRFYNIDEFIRALDSWGLTDALLPFLLIFIVFYAVLIKTKILGPESKKLSLAFAFIVAAIVVMLHINNVFPANADIVDIINKSIPGVSLVVVAIVGFLLMIGILGAAPGEGTFVGGAGIAVYLLFLYVAFVLEDVSFWILLLLAAIMSVLIFYKSHSNDKHSIIMKIVTFAAVTLVFLIFLNSAGLLKMPYWLQSPGFIAGIVVAVIFGSVIGIVFRGEEHH